MPEYPLENADATASFGERLAGGCEPGCLIFLLGNLGAGKTTLARGFLRGLGYKGRVKSPTYTLVEPYDTRQGIAYHLDLYRLVEPEELEWIGIRDVFDGTHCCLIEWPERGQDILPEPDLVVRLETVGQSRRLFVSAHSVIGERVLAAI